MKKIISLLIFILLTSTLVNAQESDSTKIARLEERIKKLEEKFQQNELEKILKEAKTVSTEKKVTKKKTKVFKSGQRSLQAINPEISVTGDMYGKYITNKNNFTKTERSGVYFRKMDIHFQGGLDPFSFTKAIVEFNPDGVELGEAYITLNKFVSNVSLTAGKFRQQFGIVNRWHVHSLDQQDYPLALKTILGDDGLNQIGVSLDWTMPAFTSDANNLIIQITNGRNDNLFSGQLFSFPSVLGHFKNYWDLTSNTYLELGFTGMIGKNNLKGYDTNNKLILDDTRITTLGGVDLTLFWQPANQALYKSFLWRTELYYANKELLNSRIKTWGGYSYIEYKFAEQWQVGTRFDYTQPFEINNSSRYSYQIVPYITWWQSHWVRMRLQYNYLNGTDITDPVSTLRLQMVWAVGPHKHDRY